MPKHNHLYKAACLLAALALVSCNSNTTANNNKATTDTVHTAAPAAKPVDPAIEKLLGHFKENNTFPVVIDSIYMTRVDKHDSLGANEVKQLAQSWLKDSLIDNPDNTLKDFYTIDSVKAKHAFAQWAEKLDIGMMKFANAYGLQKIKLDDNTTLLTWALHCSSYEADPGYDFTNVYFTELYDGKIAHTFLLGQLNYSGDPPSAAQTIVTGKLAKDGKLTLEWNNLVEDLDAMTGELTHVHYEYAITNGQIIKKTEKADDVKEVKVKE